MQINDQEYELKYSLKRLSLIERVTGKSTMSIMVNSKGMFTVADLMTYFAYGLKESGSEVYVQNKKAMDIAEQVVEQSYIECMTYVAEALERDCPFLFRES